MPKPPQCPQLFPYNHGSLSNRTAILKTPSLGILTGISYVSGLDYYRGINERVLAGTPKRRVMAPNPPVIMVSVDCDEYAYLLSTRAFDEVDTHLLNGVTKLVAAGCDVLVIASNTGHVCVPAVEKAHPELAVLHIADCCATELRRRGLSSVGLVGTKPTMQEDYLKARLALHGIETLVPEEEDMQDAIYDIICQELSYNVFNEQSRELMVGVIRQLESRGAQGCILGCTEIELLVKQEHVPGLPLLPSAEIHIEAAADLLLGKLELSDVLPPSKN